tara:strand:- start:12090 stop:13079 length:990 start_codon:yes stop_codon:yes gene_type:complete
MYAALFISALHMINPERVDHFSIPIATASGEVTVYPGVIEFPEKPSNRAAMLFSGGLVADIDWSVPGSIEHQGNTIELTISGEPTRDGKAIADALLDAGFIVVRYSSVPEGQMLTNTTPIAFPATVELAQLAWDQAVERTRLDPSRIGVVGHSMGATRGVLTSNGQAGGYVLMAGAYITPTMESPRALAEQALSNENTKDSTDYDGSGEVSGWEIAASNAIASSTVRGSDRLTNNGHEYPWPSDLLIEHNAKICGIWGGLDNISYHAPVLEHLYEAAHKDHLNEHLETLYFPKLGHQLCEEADRLIGPIDAAVLQQVVRWLEQTIPEDN